jgi:hypothetical protein
MKFGAKTESIDDLDFSASSCVWVGPDCWKTEDWRCFCVHCGTDMGGVCQFHYVILTQRTADDAFCRFCGLTGRESEILRFEKASR